MTQSQAKEILILYRPGTGDAEDVFFSEARQLCDRDPELKKWFEDQCAIYLALRAKLKEAAPPEGFKEQIIAERKIRTAVWRRPAVLATAAACALILLGSLWLFIPRSSNYQDYRNHMVSVGLRAYGMDLYGNNLDLIRTFLAKQHAESDYVLPAGLEKNAQTTGCVVLAWSGKPVSMICFNSGRPLSSGRSSDIFLFVTDNSALPDAPDTTEPSIAKINRAATASWRKAGKTYLLVAEGDEEFLRRFL